jgi:acetylornithine aminotransferase
VILEQKLVQHAAQMEVVARDLLGAIPEVLAVTGKGLLLGIELDCPAKLIVEGLLQQKIIVGGCDRPNMIRLLPPLTIKEEHLRHFADALTKALANVKQPA